MANETPQTNDSQPAHICRKLHADAHSFATLFSRSLEALRNASVPYQWTDADCIRLLTLRTWTQRYKISLDYVVETLINYWDRRIRKPRGSTGSVGVRLATFCGEHSQRILEEALLRDFPNHENENAWRSKCRTRMLAATCYVGRNPSSFARGYRTYVEARRNELEAAERKLRLRPFRGNPFVR